MNAATDPMRSKLRAVDEAAERDLDRLARATGKGTLVSPKTDVADVSAVQASCNAASSRNGNNTTDVAKSAESSVGGFAQPTAAPDVMSIPADMRSCYRCFECATVTKEHGELRAGVWHFNVKYGKGEEPPTLTSTWICSPLQIAAVTHDSQDNNFGRLLRFKNTNDTWRTWAMPMELLAASGDELRRELLAMGVRIDPGEHRTLGRYLQSVTPQERVRCVLQTGWADAEFVLPDEVIGPEPEGVIFQCGERGHDEYTCAGTLDGWRNGIAARAVGNPILTLAMSAAFAGPLIAKCNAESGGLHFVGDSSAGKTTAIEAACSVWGGPNYKRSWRATANGMEGAAALFNDGLLALDEISECDPREVGGIVYALGNGHGKQRASRTGNARGVVRWRSFVLSSGERSIATAMAEGGQRAKAGQGVRLLDVPADRAYGIFDDLHDIANGAALADSIKRASAKHYGYAGREFLHKLTLDPADHTARLEAIKSRPEFSPDGAEGQHKRAAARFALIALAGELATFYGITGWPTGMATDAAIQGFRAWRSLRGKGNDERRQIAEMATAFIAKHGDSRFSNMSELAIMPIHNRAGWWRDEKGTRVYLFTSSGLREALPGVDFKHALDVLQSLGALTEPGGNGERARVERIGGRVMKLYHIRADVLESYDGC